MITESLIRSLHPLEVKTLNTIARDTSFHAQLLAEQQSWKIGQANQAISWLAGRGCLEEVKRYTTLSFEMTELGEEYKEKGTPTERLIALLQNEGPKTMPELAAALGLENKDIGSAFGSLSKQGAAAMDNEKRASLIDPSKAEGVIETRQLLDLASSAPDKTLSSTQLTPAQTAVMDNLAKKRGAASAPFRTVEREIVEYRLTDLGIQTAAALQAAGITGEEIGTLTSEILKKGSWKTASIRPYSVNLRPARIAMGRRNPYCEYLDWVKNKLTNLGFEEFDGPLVETEFWNSDALFMPQFHSARDIHDVYYVDEPRRAKEIEQPYLDRVAAAHENGGDTGSRGWEYTFD
ncbi:MAG: phenylalanine--tRNA ligase subunit alpha, partial [Spirochaetales bacterium]|nr:phenylalanine--tRNA ligase subunit alpha [Spirochaetales bacterium]